MAERKRRGRPTNVSQPKLVEADRTIALTVHRLSMWGFPMRRVDGVYQTVGRLALEVLRRSGHSGGGPQPLSEAAVEKIYKAWRTGERARRHWTTGNDEGALRERWRFPIDYLQRARPRRGWGLERYARKLLLNGGKWRFAPTPNDWHSRPLELTPTAEKAFRTVARIRPPKRGN